MLFTKRILNNFYHKLTILAKSEGGLRYVYHTIHTQVTDEMTYLSLQKLHFNWRIQPFYIAWF